MIRSLRRNSLDSAQNTRRPGADRDDTPCNARPKSLRRRLLLKGRRLDAREIIYAAAAAAATLPAPSPQPTTTTTTTTDLTYRSAAAVHNNNRWRGTPEGRAADGRPAIEYEWRGGQRVPGGGWRGQRLDVQTAAAESTTCIRPISCSPLAPRPLSPSHGVSLSRRYCVCVRVTGRPRSLVRVHTYSVYVYARVCVVEVVRGFKLARPLT